MPTVRAGLVVLGVAFVGYGAWLLHRWQNTAQLRQVAEWAVGGVVLHDVLFAPVVAGIGWLGLRLLPRAAAAAATVAGIVLVSLTAAAFAVLGRSGDGGKNHTLLGRNYVEGWLSASIVILLAVSAVAAVGILVRRARRRRPDGAGHGGR